MAIPSRKTTIYSDLRKTIEGQHVTVPSLYQLAPDWKPSIHPDYVKAREVLDPWIRRWVPDDTICYKMEQANFAMFAAVLCSDSSFERLCTVAKHFAWYFIWDDIFDCGTLQYNVEVAETYRDASLQYFNWAIMSEGLKPDLSSFLIELQNALICWDEIGDHIRQECSTETRQVFLDWMLAYVASVSNVDSFFTGDSIPSVDKYWERRELTAAVYSVMALIPFAHGFDILKEDVEDDNMMLLWKHASYLVHITNDMFSLRKEFNDNQLENLIPITMAHTGLSANQAMQLAYHICLKEVDGFNSRAKTLRKSSGYCTKTESLIRGCEDVFMGLIHWRFVNQPKLFSWLETGGLG
ncbi:isoprenoid synthase domain-containing protein [Aspergillus venezuelensis]